MLGGTIRNRRRIYDDEEEGNPMEGALNIVDAMLVFACGLMLSLIIFWNVDLQSSELVPAMDATEVQASSASADEVAESIDTEAEYEKMGTVYVDPNTGKMYLVEEGSVPAEGTGQEAAPTE